MCAGGWKEACRARMPGDSSLQSSRFLILLPALPSTLDPRNLPSALKWRRPFSGGTSNGVCVGDPALPSLCLCSIADDSFKISLCKPGWLYLENYPSKVAVECFSCRKIQSDWAVKLGLVSLLVGLITDLNLTSYIARYNRISLENPSRIPISRVHGPD